MKKILIGVVTLLFISVHAYAELWNKVVGQYNDNVITLWDVQREIQVDRVLKSKKTDKPISRDEIKSFLKRKIVEELILLEASGFKISGLSEKQKNAVFLKFKKKFTFAQYNQFLKEYQWKEEQLQKIVLRPTQVDRFVKDKILSAYVYITEAEISEYLKRNKKVTRLKAKSILKKKKVQKNLKDWIQSIKRRNLIRIVVE